MVPHVVESEDCNVDMVVSRLVFRPFTVVSTLLFRSSHICSALVLIELTVVATLL